MLWAAVVVQAVGVVIGAWCAVTLHPGFGLLAGWSALWGATHCRQLGLFKSRPPIARRR